jgi:hypothetical protein
VEVWTHFVKLTAATLRHEILKQLNLCNGKKTNETINEEYSLNIRMQLLCDSDVDIGLRESRVPGIDQNGKIYVGLRF